MKYLFLLKYLYSLFITAYMYVLNVSLKLHLVRRLQNFYPF